MQKVPKGLRPLWHTADKPFFMDFLRVSPSKRVYRRCAIGAVGLLALVTKGQ